MRVFKYADDFIIVSSGVLREITSYYRSRVRGHCDYLQISTYLDKFQQEIWIVETRNCKILCFRTVKYGGAGQLASDSEATRASRFIFID